jgi:hypothetical protein
LRFYVGSVSEGAVLQAPAASAIGLIVPMIQLVSEPGRPDA